MLLIEQIYNNSQAQKLRLKEGDIIYKYDNIRTTEPNRFSKIVKNRIDKKEIELIIIRDNKLHKMTLKGGRIGIKVAVAKLSKQNISLN